MADSVTAIQQGFDFQEQFFWHKACFMYTNNSNVTHIGWEVSGTPGFDDVAVYYEPVKLSTYGYPIKKEYFQVKFHVTHNRAFTSEALTDPEFIGATANSLLQKLKSNFDASPEEYATTEYTIVNTWGIDREDTLITLIDNQGAIRMSALFDGSGPRAKMGKIRKMWREHLGLDSDEALIPILRQLRILPFAKSGEGLQAEMNFGFTCVGLKTATNDKRTNPYSGLIQRLHREGRNYLGREELKDVLANENLWVSSTSLTVKSEHTIGVRTFLRGTDTIGFETDELLCLLAHFDGRFAINEDGWQKSIVPELKALSDRALATGKPLTIHLDSHASVAFTMGYLLPWKTGVKAGIIQKTASGGRILFNLENEIGNQPCAANWEFSESLAANSGDDIVLAISVTHNLLSEVKEYAESALLNTSRIIHAKIHPTTGYNSIRGGSHILKAVEEIVAHVRATRSAKEKAGSVHIFMAAPNAFAFCLGQSCHFLGKVVLYEFDFENQRTGTYHKSISLPI